MQSSPTNLTMIGLANPPVANTKQLSATPGGGTLQDKATENIEERKSIIKELELKISSL